jgi:ubiquinol-cytochrome c reductase iron-sulfur subunit
VTREPGGASNRNSGAERVIAALFLCASGAAAGSIAAYWNSADTQIQGLLYFLAFGGVGAGLIVWANVLLGGEQHEEHRTALRGSSEDTAAVDDELERGGALSRRTVLRRSLWVAGGSIGAAVVVPVGSLGPSPGKSLLHTGWREGVRVATRDGTLVAARDVPLDGLLTVFPEHDLASADGQVVLTRVDEALLRLPSRRRTWAPDGIVAYSKVCTHAGCPVGLYQADSHRLLCPCHQSTFDVLAGAPPISGPAAWPLPQLPLSIDEEGILRAAGELSAPVGPGWWHR